MPSRGSSSASARLRRAKSSASVKAGSVPQHLDPETARQHALAAANIAYDRAGGRKRGSSDNHEVMLGACRSPSPSERSQQMLHRRQSVRFTGPNAVPSRQRSITRRTAPGYNEASEETRDQRPPFKRSDSPSRHNDTFLTALPPIESFPSTPSSYRKLRKAKSMFSPRKGQSLAFANATPKSYVPQQHYRRLSSDDHRPPPKMGGLDISSPLLKDAAVNSSRKYEYIYNQDAAIQLARNQYLRQLEQQRLKQRPSILSMSKRRKSQKTFRKTVRTSSTNSDANAIGSEQMTAQVATTALSNKVRRFSVKLKEKFQGVFRRHSEAEQTFPRQQVDAQRLHFGDYLSAASGVDHEGPLPPTPDKELLSRVSSRASSIHRMPVHLDRKASPGSIRSVRSISSSVGRSRITSWTNSTATNTLTKQQLIEKKRLSIIQENGGPHQPSSSAGMIGTVARKSYAVFRKPLRSANGTGRVNGPVDSQRIFSALQKRLDEHSRGLPKDEPDFEPNLEYTPRQTSQESQPKAQFNSHGRPQTTIRILTPEPDDVRHVSYVTSVPRTSSQSSLACKPLNIHTDFLEGRLTYQQIAERNETLGRSAKRPLREVKSAFFPSTVHFQNKQTSPYRRALRSSIEEERIAEEGHAISMPKRAFTPDHNKLSVPTRNSVSGSSVYSKSPHGTSDFSEASPSVAKSDSSGEPGTATIVGPTTSLNFRSSAVAPRAISRTDSSAEWKGWMASQVAHLGRQRHDSRHVQSRENIKPLPATHRRENAQIDGDDTQIRSKHKRDPASAQLRVTSEGNSEFRPPLRHKTSDQMDEKFPLRFPLLERATSSETIKHNVPARRIPGAQRQKVPSIESTRNSSSQKHVKPAMLNRVASEAQTGYRDLQGKGPNILAGNTNSNQRQQGDALGVLQTHSSGNIRRRYSPERAERLRRMQSSNAMASKENIKSRASLYNIRHHQQEKQAINDHTPGSSPGGYPNLQGSGILDSTTTEQQPGGSHKLVDMFLSTRKSGLAPRGGSSPVFI